MSSAQFESTGILRLLCLGIRSPLVLGIRRGLSPFGRSQFKNLSGDRMKRIIVYFIAALILIGSNTPLKAATFCGNLTSHFRSENSSYPFSESILPAFGAVRDFEIDGNWKTIISGCPAASGKNLDAGSTVNALLRAYLNIKNTGELPGTKYEIRLIRTVPGAYNPSNPATILATYGWYVRTLEGFYPNSEHFSSTIQALPAGDWEIHLQGRVIDSGRKIKFQQQFLTIQGAPSTYPSGNSVASGSYAINGAWSS